MTVLKIQLNVSVAKRRVLFWFSLKRASPKQQDNQAVLIKWKSLPASSEKVVMMKLKMKILLNNNKNFNYNQMIKMRKKRKKRPTRRKISLINLMVMLINSLMRQLIRMTLDM